MNRSNHSATWTSLRHRALPLLFLSGFAAAAGPSAGLAQPLGCTTTARPNPPRQVLLCADGLTLTAEPQTQLRILDNTAERRADRVEIGGHGLMIELPPAARRKPLQILTPHAVATVRGTVWAVDVTPTRTSVFVQSGVVAVSRRGARASVDVRAGEGIDVEAGGRDLKVRRWAPERADKLLARFGR